MRRLLDNEGNWRTFTQEPSLFENKLGAQIKIFEYRRVWSWLRLNAGGRPNTCKSNGNIEKACFLWWRVADGWVRSGKLPDRGGQQLETVANTAYTLRGGKSKDAVRCAQMGLASRWGKGSPRRRSLAGLRGWSATLGLRHGPDSYGRQQ